MDWSVNWQPSYPSSVTFSSKDSGQSRWDFRIPGAVEIGRVGVSHRTSRLGRSSSISQATIHPGIPYIGHSRAYIVHAREPGEPTGSRRPRVCALEGYALVDTTSKQSQYNPRYATNAVP